MMTEQVRSLVNAEFLTFLAATNEAAASAVRSSLRTFDSLLKYGWSAEDMTIARQTGYNLESHLTQGNSKHGYDSRILYDWLLGHYRVSKAATIGLTFEEFLRIWCRLAEFLSRGYRGFRGEYYTSQQAIYDYIRARRRARLSHKEAQSLVLYNRSDAIRLWTQLRRRGLQRRFVELIINVSREKIHTVEPKEVVEAYRKGASQAEIISAIKEGNHALYRLAMARRETMRQ